MNFNKKSATRAVGCVALRKREVSKVPDNCISETFQQQALEIREPGENFDPKAEPKSGEEFLMKMLYERKRCPAVVAKRPRKLQKVSGDMNNAKPNYLQNNQEPKLNDAVPSGLRPTPEWRTLQCVDFLSTREKVNRLRLELESQNYSNELEPPLISETSEWLKFCQEHPPLLSIIMRINQPKLEQLLDMLCEWLRKGADLGTVEPSEETEQVSAPQLKIEYGPEPDPPSELKPDPGLKLKARIKCESTPRCEVQLEPAAGYANVVKSKDSEVQFELSTSHDWLGSWIYATLACLHLPIEPNVHSTLREIARLCIRLRNELSEPKFRKAAPYNLFICLISNVFDQLDFAQFV